MKDINVIALNVTKHKKEVCPEEIAGIGLAAFFMIVAVICLILRFV